MIYVIFISLTTNETRILGHGAHISIHTNLGLLKYVYMNIKQVFNRTIECKLAQGLACVDGHMIEFYFSWNPLSYLLPIVTADWLALVLRV